MSNEYLKTLPIIGFDGGNKLAKTPGSVFHAGIDALSAQPSLGFVEETDLLRYNGQYYCVSGKRLKYERDKSINDNYLYLTLIGIAKELKARGMEPTQEIILAAGLPPGHMASEELMRSLREYYMRNGGVYRFQCGGVQHHITIRDVIVCPQAYSIFLTLSKDIVFQPNVHVVDVGGGTVDDVEFVGSRPVISDMLSLDMGVIHLYTAIQAQLLNQFGRKITESQIDDILTGKTTLFKPEHINTIHTMAEAHVNNIFGTVREMGADWQSGYVVFCGGTPILLRDYFEKYAERQCGAYTIVNDICANAKGFEVFARFTLKNRA